MHPYIKQLKPVDHNGLKIKVSSQPKLVLHIMLILVLQKGNITCNVSKAMLEGSKNNNKNIDEVAALYIVRHSNILHNRSMSVRSFGLKHIKKP